MRRKFWDNLKDISGFESISEQALARANDNNGKGRNVARFAAFRIQ